MYGNAATGIQSSEEWRTLSRVSTISHDQRNRRENRSVTVNAIAKIAKSEIGNTQMPATLKDLADLSKTIPTASSYEWIRMRLSRAIYCTYQWL